MKIYQSSSKLNFFSEIVEFSTKNFAEQFCNLEILLPNGLSCNQLQKLFVQKLGATILPNINPFTGLTIDNETMFQISHEKISSITQIEEKITLATTIHSYKELNYSLTQSLLLAPALANLFFEFEVNNINVESLYNLPKLEQPEHWYSIYNFLCYASYNWHNKIANLGKLTRAAYQKIVLDSKLKKLRHNNNHFLLLAGITTNNLMTDNFLSNVLKLDNVSMIFPPFPVDYIDIKKDFSPEEGLYEICKLFKSLNIKFSPKRLGVTSPTIFDQLISESFEDSLKEKINYIEFNNIFHEAEYIALKCKEYKNKKVAIIVHNENTKEQYCNFLDKYNIDYNDIYGSEIVEHQVISLILLLSKHLCSEFNTKTFFSIISHPLINSMNAQALKNLIRKKTRLISNLDSISELVYENGDNILKTYFAKLYLFCNHKILYNNFHDILTQIIQILESFIPNIWQYSSVIADVFFEIIQQNWKLNLDNINEFPEILKQLLVGKKISETDSNTQIIISGPDEASFVNYDLLVMTDLNEDSYPISKINNPWINNQMQRELGLENISSNLGKSIYSFYLNLQNQEVLLTRSKKKDGNKQYLASKFILHLKHILGDKFNIFFGVLDLKKENQANQKKTKDTKIKKFPSIISATDIEMLIKSPYNFYSKKFLNLKKIEEISEEHNLAEFGNFFHLVVETYTKNYKSRNSDKKIILIETAKSILDKINMPDYIKKSWFIKINSIASAFIKFDEKIRSSSIHTYSEIKGKLDLNILGQNITIVAIADRIDINKDNLVTILDYKTGTVPTKQDVLYGFAPQLLIEAMIFSQKGFIKNELLNINTPAKYILKYVKINSSEPYLSFSEILLTEEEISKHNDGLISLLKHYIQNSYFDINVNFIKYDNYKHLARRIVS